MEEEGMVGFGKVTAELSLRHIRNGVVTDYGVVSRKKVTDDFAALVIDAMQSVVGLNFDAFKYHDTGTDNTPEDATDSGLIAPCGEARDTGTQTEGASANIYKTVATHTYAGSFAIVEHGVFNAAAAGVLLDRSVFTAVNVISGDQIEFTYQFSFTSGG